MRKSDLFSGVALLMLGLITLFVIIPDQISRNSFGGLPPDFFPRVLIQVFIGIALVLLLSRAWATWRRLPHAESLEVPLGVRQAMFISGTALCLFVTYWLMAYVNFIFAGIFIVAVAAAAMGSLRANPVRLVIISIVGPTAIYYAFRYLFLIFLPT